MPAQMYLDSVLADIKKESAPPKSLHAEHLFKLNEAVFNLNEEDTVDVAMAAKLFQAVENITKAYRSGKYDNTDSNFFYDYLALLGTMQNQHFFSQKQTEKMLDWIGELCNDPSRGESGKKDGGKASSGGGGLESENERLRKRLAKYEDPDAPSGRNSKRNAAQEQEAGKSKKGGKSGGKSSWDDDYYEEEPPAKGRGRGRGKGKGKMDDEPAQSAKGKGKGDSKADSKGGKDSAKGKGGKKGEPEPKGKGKDDMSAKGKGKGKDGKDDGKAKSKGKGKDKDDDDAPPLRSSKAKGKGKSKGGQSKKGNYSY